jgi:hypothetical protein
MLDKIRDRMAFHLSQHQVGLLSVNGEQGAWSMPVRYRLGENLTVECLLPRWADGTYYLEQDSRVVLIVPLNRSLEVCWLRVQGEARPVAHPNWEEWFPPEEGEGVPPASLYEVVRVTPRRLNLFDERRGWGARETLEV